MACTDAVPTRPPASKSCNSKVRAVRREQPAPRGVDVQVGHAGGQGALGLHGGHAPLAVHRDGHHGQGIAAARHVQGALVRRQGHGHECAAQCQHLHGVKRALGCVRDGSEQEIPIDEIVVGDVVKLSAGDMIPADVVLDS